MKKKKTKHNVLPYTRKKLTFFSSFLRLVMQIATSGRWVSTPSLGLSDSTEDDCSFLFIFPPFSHHLPLRACLTKSQVFQI